MTHSGSSGCVQRRVLKALQFPVFRSLPPARFQAQRLKPPKSTAGPQTGSQAGPFREKPALASCPSVSRPMSNARNRIASLLLVSLLAASVLPGMTVDGASTAISTQQDQVLKTP